MPHAQLLSRGVTRSPFDFAPERASKDVSQLLLIAKREADDFFGTTVHYAARVAGHALGGEILVSSVVRDLVAGGSDVTFLEGREVELKGIEGSHRLFAVDLA